MNTIKLTEYGSMNISPVTYTFHKIWQQTVWCQQLYSYFDIYMVPGSRWYTSDIHTVNIHI